MKKRISISDQNITDDREKGIDIIKRMKHMQKNNIQKGMTVLSLVRIKSWRKR
jgi:hypothetical protein